MSLPNITVTPLGFTYKWLDELIEIEATRLKYNGDGRLTGEVTISTQAPGYAPHLHQASFNFTSSATRDKLAKKLKELYNCDWDTVLEQLCVYTLRKYRSGSPVEEVWTSGESQPPSYLINPLVIKNYPTVLFGDPSAGKSTMAQLFITALTLPWYDNPIGLDIVSENEPYPCLLLDYENDKETAQWQIGCIQRGMGLPEYSFHYRRCYLPLAEDIEEIIKALDETKARILIIDSLGPACGGELNEARPALAYFNALRKLNRTSITLAHNAKNSTGGKSVYGSMFFHALARSIWEVKKVQEAGEDEIEIGLFHRKPPPFSKLARPQGFKFLFDGDKTVIQPKDPKTVGEFIEHMDTQMRILDLLTTGKMSPAEIAEALQINQPNARNAIKRLKDKNKIVKVGDKYGLLVTA